VFLDESGASTQMTRNYGRAPRGERVPEGTPHSHWSTLTMLAALTTKGLQAPMTIESPTDGDVFLEHFHLGYIVNSAVAKPRLGVVGSDGGE